MVFAWQDFSYSESASHEKRQIRDSRGRKSQIRDKGRLRFTRANFVRSKFIYLCRNKHLHKYIGGSCGRIVREEVFDVIRYITSTTKYFGRVCERLDCLLRVARGEKKKKRKKREQNRRRNFEFRVQENSRRLSKTKRKSLLKDSWKICGKTVDEEAKKSASYWPEK